MATNNGGPNANRPKVTPIRENSPEKKELIALFESKKWERFPKKHDTDLEQLMTKNNWSKEQVSRHFGIWNRLGGNVGLALERSRDEVITSLKDNCDSVEVLLERTWASRDIINISTQVQFPAGSKERLNDNTKLWNDFRDDVLGAVADNRALSGNQLSKSTAQYTDALESLVQGMLEKFEGTPTQSFLYLFAYEFVFQLKRSYAEPDIESIEKDVVEAILNETSSQLPPSHANTLYFVGGFVAKAVNAEGIRRQKKGFLFKAFAAKSCVPREAIAKACKSTALPTEKTARLDEGGLLYPTLHFYNVLVHIERIYCALLTDDNLIAYGPMALKRLHELISSNNSIRERLAVPIGKNAVGANIVIDYVLQTFANVRSSDYASKLLSRSRKSYATATRTGLQVKSEAPGKAKSEPKGMDIDTVQEDALFEKECVAMMEEVVASRTVEDEQMVRQELDGCDSAEDSLDTDSDSDDGSL